MFFSLNNVPTTHVFPTYLFHLFHTKSTLEGNVPMKSNNSHNDLAPNVNYSLRPDFWIAINMMQGKEAHIKKTRVKKKLL